VLLTLEDESDFAHEAAAGNSTAGWLPVGLEEEADTTPTDLFFRLHISRCGRQHDLLMTVAHASALIWQTVNLGVQSNL
jgi:hypothetical protein